MNSILTISRRRFLHQAGLIAASLGLPSGQAVAKVASVPVYGHLWVYASKFPPDWDCTPILERVFQDFTYAGIEGIEVMESLLRNKDILTVGRELVQKYKLPITGTSYYGDMWRKQEHVRLLEDIEFVVERLSKLGGNMLGITVGNAQRMKTEDELDAQADLLNKIVKVCRKSNVEPNIHNHDFEVKNDLHDFKGIIKRIPDIPLGPDISWLQRAGVDPVNFVKTYGRQMVYIHLRDQGTDDLFTEAVGEGVINFGGIAAALKEIDYAGKAAIELAYEKPALRPERENWKLSREYVKKVFQW
jgi:sugar phosphate isomerase/epimerase